MRKALTILSLFLILAFGIYAATFAFDNLGVTYDGSNVNVVDLYYNPHSYVIDEASGIAEIIVDENLEKTMAANNVAAVVFDFRGYDTLGESFILLTAIAGTYVILNGLRKTNKGESQAPKEVMADEDAL